MENKSLENSIISLIVRYLIFRDTLLASLLLYLVLNVYNSSSQLKVIFLVFVLISGVLSIYHLMKIIQIKTQNKDSKLIQSFDDEYFRSIWVKGGYHGFVAMLMTSLLVIIASIVLTALKLKVFIPLYLVGGIIIFIGILVFDLSKVIQVRD